MLDLRCKKHFPNPLIEVGGVPTCVLCGPVVIEEKQRDKRSPKKSRNSFDFSEVSCSLCQKVKKRRKLGGYEYVDELGNKWLRRRCPDCKPAMIYKQNIRRPRKLEERRCLTCTTLFRPKNAKHVYCTLKCTQSTRSVQDNVHYASSPPDLASKQLVPKNKVKSYCLSCKKKILWHKPRKFCNKTCANKHNYKNNDEFKAQLKELKAKLKNSSSYKAWGQYKKIYGDRITSKARLPGTTWKDLDVFYNNCPPNHQVELIVPLMNDDVSGLFVPWNLVYKKINDNNK